MYSVLKWRSFVLVLAGLAFVCHGNCVNNDGPLYCVVDLDDNCKMKFLDGVPDGGGTHEHRTSKMVFRKIPSGDFMFQGKVKVRIARSFYIGIFEVTRGQFSRITSYTPMELEGENPSWERGRGLCKDRPTRPVGCVSWQEVRVTTNDIDRLDGELSIRDLARRCDWPKRKEIGEDSVCGILSRRTGRRFDLPTSVQWEYACKAGTTSRYNVDEKKMPFGWCAEAVHVCGPQEVGRLFPNAWGLFDMHGNVSEWCRDYYGEEDDGFVNATNTHAAPLPDANLRARVVRGGWWQQPAVSCSSEARNAIPEGSNFEPYVGFRLVMLDELKVP